MDQQEVPSSDSNGYPIGRGYGHDYMRGGEVFDGYGYSKRDEYARCRGELAGVTPEAESATPSDDAAPEEGTRPDASPGT
jgi:hypothetical protein